MKLGNDPGSALLLTALERAVLLALADAMGADGAALRAQVERLRVTGRTHSGVGFVTRLEAAADAAALPAAGHRPLRSVRARHPQLSEPAEFIVQIRDGRLAAIEAFCPEGLWPADDAGFRIEAMRGPQRALS